MSFNQYTTPPSSGDLNLPVMSGSVHAKHSSFLSEMLESYCQGKVRDRLAKVLKFQTYVH